MGITYDKKYIYIYFYRKSLKIVCEFIYLTLIFQSLYIIPCSKDESLQDNMITKEFKSVVVLVILGDIVEKKIFIGKKNKHIVSLRDNLTSYPHNNISFVQIDPKIIEKLTPKCCS